MDFNYKSINKSQSIAFDFLKIILLFQVLMGHAIALSLPKISQIDLDVISNYLIVIFKIIFSFGGEAAYIFIFLSGFFTSKIFLAKNLKFDLKAVLKKRFFRIYPIYAIALILTVLLDALGLYIFEFNIYRENPFNLNVGSVYNSKILILNLLSLEPTFTNSFGSNTPLWTLGYLVQFFFIASLLKSVAVKFQFNWIFIMPFLLIFFSIFNLEFSILFFVWFLGVLSKELKFDEINLKLCQVIILFIILIFTQRFFSSFISMILTPITSFLIFLIINNIPKYISNKLIKFERIPDVSYVLYAVHMPILFLIFGFYNHNFSFSYLNSFLYIFVGSFTAFLISFSILKVVNFFIKK
tara:strand:+ start:6775 stop:7836 length:1062 start_codon:yes stop_codon:yes gene_type:complete